MIVEDRCFVWAYNEDNSYDRHTVGKWMFKGSLSRIKEVFPTIDSLVEKGDIYRSKYTTKDPLYDPFPGEKPHLFVYADDITKYKVHRLLTDLKLRPLTWKYDWQTEQDWRPGGRLYNQRLIQLYGLGLDGPWE